MVELDILLNTAMHQDHLLLGAKMCGFAGYDMPLQYADGVVKEHLWTRNNVGIFDVSHMGVLYVCGGDARRLMEYVTPSIFGSDMTSRYTVLLNSSGGIVDDMIVTRIGPEEFVIVVNASRKHVDMAYIIEQIGELDVSVSMSRRSIIAVQGCKAQEVLSRALDRDLSGLRYMNALKCDSGTLVSRVGYTGEDGFEVVMAEGDGPRLWRKLLEDSDVKPIGLAARDSLRLEMGYPLYGSDIDETTSPVEASLGWLIGANKSFYGSERVLCEKESGAVRKRVGVILEERGVLRSGTPMFDSKGIQIGLLTSGGYSPILQKSIGMLYVDGNIEVCLDQSYQVLLHGRLAGAKIASMPFIAPKVYKGV